MRKQIIPLWVIPALFFFVHLLAVWGFAQGNADLTGPRADAGSMAWIAWMMIDFPIGFVAVSIGESMPTNTLAVWSIALIGGIQWILWGLCATAMIRGIQVTRENK